MILKEPTSQLMQHSFLDYTLLLTELIESVRMENNKTRQHFFQSIQNIIINSNRFLPYIINRDPGRLNCRRDRSTSFYILDCETALVSLLLTVFEVFRVQMGAELLNTILQTTFAAFNMFVSIRSVVHSLKT